MSHIIAVSGKSGCGNSTVSRLLAERLGIRLINYTLRNMAVDRGIAFEHLLELASTDEGFDRELDAKQIELAHAADCVIGSRLSMWLLPDAALKVYLWASPEIRAERIQKREGGELSHVLTFTKTRDDRDHDRYLRLYGIDNDDSSCADITINTERFSPSKIASIIVSAALAEASRAT